MKIGIVSDTHLGFGWNSERREDSFRNMREAFDKVSDVDVILMPGDIFDTKIPRQEVLSRAVKVLRNRGRNLEVKGIGFDREDDRIPVVAIHGTHERRGKESVNPVELLDDAGFLVHLHNDSVSFEKGGERVNIFGMSGVPERYAPKVMARWDPSPEEGYNLLMFHQSVEGFVYTDSERDVLKLSDMPKGFDLLVDGHIHWRNLELRAKELPLIFPGSTIATQLNKKEMKTRKGVVVVDTEKEEIKFRTLEGNRKVFREDIDVSGLGENEIVDKAVSRIEEVIDPSSELKPLLRIDIKGETDSSVRVSQIRNSINGAILKIGNKTVSTGSNDDVEIGEEEVEEVGVSLLSDEIGFEGFEQLFKSLADGKVEDTLEKFREMDLKELKEFLDEEPSEDNMTGEGSENTSDDGNQDTEESVEGENLLDYV